MGAVVVVGSFAAVEDKNVGEGMVAAAARMAVGDRRARSEGCSSAGWGGSARARGVVAAEEAGRALSGGGDGRPVVVAERAKTVVRAAERDEATVKVEGHGLSTAGEGDWGRSRSRCSILALPCSRSMELGS